VKTLDQIWDENFEFLPPGDLTGYTGSCGNGLGGSAEDNQKDPLNTLADKINSIYNDPDGAPLSDAAKQAALDQLISNYFSGQNQDRLAEPLDHHTLLAHLQMGQLDFLVTYSQLLFLLLTLMTQTYLGQSEATIAHITLTQRVSLTLEDFF
jgi:hypothetical protein